MADQKFLATTQQTLAWFRQRISSDEIEMRPSFQREAVWTETQKSYLVDTILQGLPVPEMYLQKSVSSEGKETYTVVDGQQRLNACIGFYSGTVPIYESGGTGTKKAPRYFSDLSSDEKSAFFSYSFVVRLLPDIDDPTLRDIFKRINKNTVVLNPQELRHATYWGPFIKSAEFIANHFLWAELAVFTPNDIRRMRHVEFVSEVFVAKINGDQNKKVNLEKAYAAYESDFPDRNKVERSIIDLLNWFVEFFPDFRNTRFRKRTDAYSIIVSYSSPDALQKIRSLSPVQREEFVSKLRTFAETVDAVLRDHDGAGGDVDLYSSSVERAASDLSNRRNRRKVLENILSSV